MNRSLWPIALVSLSILILGSYLAYTQYMVRHIQDEARTYRRIATLVQQGMLSIGDEGSAQNALVDIHFQLLDSLTVPFVMFNQAGAIQAAKNTPYDTPDDSVFQQPERQRL